MKPVQVYRNLHKGCWSIRQKGKPVRHKDWLVLTDAVFRVKLAGTYIKGTITNQDKILGPSGIFRILGDFGQFQELRDYYSQELFNQNGRYY
jgi:hypothetical protein